MSSIGVITGFVARLMDQSHAGAMGAMGNTPETSGGNRI
jgi:hypothetical protein